MNEMNFQEVACKIYSVLLDYPKSRDSDRELLSIIWVNELKDCQEDFIESFLKGNLSNPETICRMRRKLQEIHPALRGTKWDSRHQMEGAVCSQLTFFDRW